MEEIKNNIKQINIEISMYNIYKCNIMWNAASSNQWDWYESFL
jgi:hypothetical protein